MKQHVIAIFLAAGCMLSVGNPPARAAFDLSFPDMFAQQNTAVPSEYREYNGVDISHVQDNGTINWTAAKNAGVDFVFVHADSSSFDIAVQGAVSVGLPIGISLDSRAVTTEESIQEAELLLRSARNYDVTLPLLLRLEPDSTPRILDAFQSGTLTRSEETKNILAFCKRIQSAGYQSMILASSKTLDKLIDRDLVASEALLCLSEHSDSYYDAEIYPYRHYSDSAVIDGIPNQVSRLSYFTKGYLPGTEPPEILPTADEIFKDIQPSDYFCSAVTYSYYHKIMSGVSSDLFEPRTVTSRAMAARILYNLEGMPAVDFVPYYADISDGQWFSQAITWARENGVMDGYGTTFGPNDAITREQFAAILYRYSKLKGLDTAVTSNAVLQQYQDSSQIHDYAWTAMQWAVQNKLIQGYSASELAPCDYTKRCDCAIIFQRYHSGFAASIFGT